MKGSLFKSAGIVSLSIFGSRVLGLLRDVVIASTFGAGALTDVFFVAFRIPNLLRRIFAEGAFNSAFVPAFTKKLKESRREAELLAGEVFAALIVLLTVTVVLGELLSPLIVKVVAPGFKGERFLYAVKLLREMFPYIMLVSLTAFLGGILNAFNRFFAPSFSTALFNLSLIVLALLLSGKFSVEALALGVIVGGTLQVLLQLPFLKEVGFRLKPIFSLSKESKKVLLNTVPGILGFAVRQISMLIDTVIASFLTTGAISYLYYANRFVQLPLGMFAIGLSQVLLPRLSRKIGEKDYHSELKAGILLCSAVVIPAAAGLIFFGKPIVDIVFNHGAFTEKDLSGTYAVLVCYSLGLFFFSMEKIVSNVYYSFEEFKIPVKVAAYTLLFNLIVNLILCFGFGMGTPGLALGTSLTSLLNLSLLLFILKKKFKIDVLKTVLELGLRYLLLSVPVAAVSFAGTLAYSGVNGFTGKLTVVCLTVLLAAGVYGALLLLLKDPVVEKLKEV